MRRPLNGTVTITQEWGAKNNVYRKGYHTGVDYAVGVGTPVYAPESGRVESGDGRAQSDGRGWFVIVYGDDGVSHHLYHLSQIAKGSGRVGEGELVGYSGNTGLSTGPHLHWETRRAPYDGNSDFNPADWLFTQPPKPPQGGDMITQNDVGPVRIITSEVKGWNFNDVHSGKLDAQEMRAWVGQPWAKFIDEGWRESEAWRNKRNEALRFYDQDRPELERKVRDLTNANVDLANKITDTKNQLTLAENGITSLTDQVAELEAQLKNLTPAGRGLDDYSLGELLSAAFKKTFKIK